MNSFQNKIYNYEVAPPGNIWDKINSALNEQEANQKISSKFDELEVIPPSDTWEKITAALNTKNETSTTHQKEFSILLRYAAAAVFIGFVAYGAIKFLNKKTDDKSLTKENIHSSPTKATTQPPLNIRDTSKNVPDNTNEAKDDAALEESKKTFAKLDFSENTKQRIRNALMMTPAELISNPPTDDNTYHLTIPENLKALFSENDLAVNVADRYVQFINCDGNIIRMSKKWADLSCCVSGEDENSSCKNKLQQWREKIACSSLAPSPGNFLDIVSLVQSLRDNDP